MLKALIQFSGGLVLFLWGLSRINTIFKELVNKKVRKIASILTFNFYTAFITGLIMTILLQSSSATIIIIISLVNSYILDFKQAVGIIVGANIGTTVTIQLISFNLTEGIELFFIMGLVCYFFYYLTKVRLSKYLGYSIIAFSILLFGLELLESSLVSLESNLFFRTSIKVLSSAPLVALLFGLIITAVVQSSSAVTALVVALAKQELIFLKSAITLALGSNVGTCITAFLAAFRGNKDAKLTAWCHLYFNLIGVLILLPLLPYFVYHIESLPVELPRQIANAHTLFNLCTAIIIFIGREQFIAIIIKIHQK